VRQFLGAALLSGLVVGCTAPVGDEYASALGNGELIDTNYCDVTALGTLETGEMLAGSTTWVEGQDIDGSWILTTPPVVDPECVPEDDDDAPGCHFDSEHGHGHHDHDGGWGDHKGGRHFGHHHGRGHFEHGNGHGYGHDHHDHGDSDDPDDPCAPQSDTVVLTPESLHCRVNGVTLGDIDGTATVNGEEGYVFHLSGQEFEDPTPDYVTLRIWEPNPAYVPGGTEPEYVLFYEVTAQFVDGSLDVSLP